MRVISRTRLRPFWEQSGRADSAGPLRAWYTHVSNRQVAWNSWADVKAAYASASLVGNCAEFNIGGNKYRLVTRILYASQKVFVLRVMNHREYDLDAWKEECGCYQPPPGKKSPRQDPGVQVKRGPRKGG
jgi:mRNA interferase HigB